MASIQRSFHMQIMMIYIVSMCKKDFRIKFEEIQKLHLLLWSTVYLHALLS